MPVAIPSERRSISRRNAGRFRPHSASYQYDDTMLGQIYPLTGYLVMSQGLFSSYMGMGGGGGTFVALSGSVPTPILVAGGGGGTGRYSGYNANSIQEITKLG